MPDQLVSDEAFYWSVVEELLEALWLTDMPFVAEPGVEGVWWVTAPEEAEDA